MALRYYTSAAPDTTLVGTIDGVTSTIQVGNPAGYPTQFPFTIAVAPDASSEELMDVTAAAGPVWTVTRGVDGTPAVSHTSGVTVRHVASGRDFREANAHVNASQQVHGLQAGSAVAGLTDTQTFTNKTYSSGVLTGTFTGSPTLSGAPIFTGDPILQDTVAANVVALAQVSGDATPRFGLGADGKLSWGTGAATRDAFLYRSGVGALKTDGSLDVAGALNVLAGGSLVGTLTGSPTLSGAPLFTGTPIFQAAAAATEALGARVAADTQHRLFVQADGKLLWGSGSAAQDTDLFRNGAGALKTTSSFEAAGGLTVATKPARIIKIESQQSKVLTNTTFGTSNVTVTSLSVTGDGSTKVKVTISWPAIQTQAAGASNCAVYIFRGSTQIGRASVYTAQGTVDVAGGSLSITDTPVAGANTYSFQVVRIGGDTGTQLIGTSASPCELIVEQFGA